MSLIRTLIRTAAVKALTDATLANANVFDSKIDQVETVKSGDKLPIITVATEDDQTNGEGREVNGQSRELEFVVEIIVASSVDADGLTIPYTDWGMEWTLDIIEYQAQVALWSGLNDWSTLLMKLVPKITRKVSRRGASAEKGVKFAARQIVWTVDTIADPTPGAAPAETLPVAKLLALMADDEELGPLSEFITKTITQPELDETTRQRIMIAITDDEAVTLGFGGDAPNQTTTEIDAVDEDSGDVLVVVPEPET